MKDTKTIQNEDKQGEKKFVSVFLFFLCVAVVLSGFANNTTSYYSSKLSSVVATARAAMWDVQIVVDTTSLSLPVNSDYSNPWRLDIINNSEVLASYGQAETDDNPGYYSYLTFSNMPENTFEVRIYDPDTGLVEDYTTYTQNQSTAIRFTGTLQPGQTKTYYVQFRLIQDDPEYETYNIQADASFHFEQAFEIVENDIDVSSGTD